MPKAEDFREELQAQIQRAHKQGRPHIEVNAGELHRKLGGYPPKAGERASNSALVLYGDVGRARQGQGEGGVSDRQRTLGVAHYPLPPAASVSLRPSLVAGVRSEYEPDSCTG